MDLPVEIWEIIASLSPECNLICRGLSTYVRQAAIPATRALFKTAIRRGRIINFTMGEISVSVRCTHTCNSWDMAITESTRNKYLLDFSECEKCNHRLSFKHVIDRAVCMSNSRRPANFAPIFLSTAIDIVKEEIAKGNTV